MSKISAESQEDWIEPAALNILGTQDRTRCTQDLRIQQLEIKHFKIYARQHRTCVSFSQKSAEISKNNTQDTDDRQELFPSSQS